MHGSSFSKWDNRDLWKKYKLSDFGLLGDPYISIDYKHFLYVSDTGGKWSGNSFRVRDFVNTDQVSFQSTDSLMEWIRKQKSKNICILAHPDRWAKNLPEWGMEWVTKNIRNYIKTLYIKLTHTN
jgi:hypothetical protein